MKVIGLINRNSKYYVIWTTLIIEADLTKDKNVITNDENIFLQCII